MRCRSWYAGLTVCVALGAAPACAGELSWPTHRGNLQRTGSIDDRPGPRQPKVLWVYESRDHFVAAPVVAGDALLVSGLGPFNSAALYKLSLADEAPQRVLWEQHAPLLSQPIVSPPCVVDGMIVFGDGMHQTDGGSLHCLSLVDGSALWQLPLPGTLIHLEGSPTVADGQVYIGAGNAGVVCAQMTRVVMEGVEQDLAATVAARQARWKELQAIYEKEKKEDPDFAIPPSAASLPQVAPKIVWQAGRDIWHVDASLAVAGDRVLVGSAFLDVEGVGHRALLCLDAADGQVKWELPLDMNPWSGPTVSGNTVLIGCSSIRLDPAELRRGRGSVAACRLDDGRLLWSKAVPGGVVSPIAVVGDVAIFTATDGRVRAWNVSDGAERWSHDMGAAMFAGPAVAGDVVYVADLKGVVAALSLADGRPLWKMELATEPAVKAPGMVYASPVVHGGRLYVATTTLGGPVDQQKTVVVCIGDK